jgi:hypothetical protein
LANSNRARGFQPYEDVLRVSPYVAGGTIYPGDLVRQDNAGAIVAASADTNPNLGVAANYATSGQEVNVWDHPEQKFVCQADDGGSVSVNQALMGLNTQIVATSGSTAFKQSRQELDASSAATNSNLPARMLAIQPAVKNAAGVNAKVVCMINNHQRKLGVVGL